MTRPASSGWRASVRASARVGERLAVAGERRDEGAAAVLLDVDPRVVALARLGQEEAVRLIHPEERRDVQLLRVDVAAKPRAGDRVPRLEQVRAPLAERVVDLGHDELREPVRRRPGTRTRSG